MSVPSLSLPPALFVALALAAVSCTSSPVSQEGPDASLVEAPSDAGGDAAAPPPAPGPADAGGSGPADTAGPPPDASGGPGTDGGAAVDGSGADDAPARPDAFPGPSDTDGVGDIVTVPLDAASDTPVDAAPGSDAAPPVDASTPDAAAPDAAAPDAVADIDAGPAACRLDPEFAGQLIPGADEPFGGVRQSTPYPASFDTGIEEVLDAIAAIPLGDFAVREVDLEVRGAIIASTSFLSPTVQANRTQFWLVDGRGWVEVQLDFRDPLADRPGFAIRSGQALDINVTGVRRNFGRPVIQAGTGWRVAAEQQPVYVEDLARPLEPTDVGRVVRVHGRLQTDSAPGCGDARCFLLNHGDGVVRFRTTSTFPRVGDCLQWVGPVSIFDGVLQLNGVHFAWFRPDR